MKTTQPDEKHAHFVPDTVLKKFAASVPTPFFLYDAAGILARGERIVGAFSWHPAHKPYFPVKVTPIPAILELLRGCGFGVLCSSELELRMAQQAGFSGREILFYAVSPQRAEAELAASLDTALLLNSVEQMAFYMAYGALREEIGVRLRLEQTLRAGSAAMQPPKTKKFGSPEAQVLSYLPQLQSSGVRRIGLQVHIGAGILQHGLYTQAAKQLASFAATVRRQMPLAWLDLGGGLGLGYRPEFGDADLEAAQPELQRIFAEWELLDVPLYTELGRWLMGPNGLLVTKVLQIRENTAILDYSTANLLRMAMHRMYYRVSPIGSRAQQEPIGYDLVGITAEPDDRIAGTRLLPPLQAGDLLAVHDTGAYEGHARNCGRLGAAAYLYQGKADFRCIRRAESVEEHLRLFEV